MTARIETRAPRLRLSAALAAAVVALSLGCAGTSGTGPSGAVRRPAGNPIRPDAPAEYDVLVGHMAALEGRTEEAREAFARAAEKDPDSAYLQRSLGRFAVQLDDLDTALGHARRAVELDPKDPEARVFLGRLHRIRRDVGGAEETLLDEQGNPVNSEAALLLYQVYLESNRLPDALRIAEDLVAQEPESLGGHMAVATVHERMGRLADAERALRRALVHHPGRFVLYSRLARMRRAAGDRDGEIAIYHEVLDTHPGHYGTLVSLADAQVAVEDLDGAIATYGELVSHYPDDQQSIRRLASLEVAVDRSVEAARRLEEALARNPELFELAYALGQVYRNASEADAAIEAFERVPPGDSAYVDARLQITEILEERGDYAGALREAEQIRTLRPNRTLEFHIAALRWRAGDLEGGTALLNDMLAENPDDDEVLYQLGVLYGMAEQIDEALATMQRTLEKNPDNAHALNYIGYTWAERGENLDEAEAMILRALELRPDDGYITDSLGWVYYMRARPLLGSGQVHDARALLKRAEEQLSIAAELTGGDPVVSEHLGDVHLLMNHKLRALEFYEEAASSEPREEEQPELLQKLEDLRRELSSP
ncbi:MAG: tetratricopeptide repeat protein [Proteobacteria bacterium]|nr:tetratricopeptide repeat protein [Pseudomonadota bacterium]